MLTALWSADKDNVDDKWNISRTKEIPCFIVQRKPPRPHPHPPPRPLGKARFGAHVGGQERQREARGAVRSGSPDGVGSQEGVTAVYGIHRSPEPDC